MPPKKGKAAAPKAPEPEVLPQGIADMEVPKATVTRLAKSTLPDDAKMAKEVPLALVRASTVFISYLAALSQEAASGRNQKTITAQHVLDSVKELGWPEGDALQKFLKTQLKAYKANAAAKKEGKPLPYPKATTANGNSSQPSAGPSTTKSTEGAGPAQGEDGPNEDVEMQGAQDGEEQEEEDIDEGEIPNDEAGEEEDEVSDAFSEPEDVEGEGVEREEEQPQQ